MVIWSCREDIDVFIKTSLDDISQMCFCSVWCLKKYCRSLRPAVHCAPFLVFFVSLAVIVDFCFHSVGQQGFVAVGICCSVEIKRERNFFLFDRYAAFNSRSASVLVLHSKRMNTSYSRDALLSFTRDTPADSSHPWAEFLYLSDTPDGHARCLRDWEGSRGHIDSNPHVTFLFQT